MKCEGWCLPAVIYIVLAVISLILNLLMDLSHLSRDHANRVRIMHLLFHIAMAVFWTGVLYWLCANCNPGWAWIVLFLPFFIGLAVMVFGSAMIVAFAAGRSIQKGVEGFEDDDSPYGARSDEVGEEYAEHFGEDDDMGVNYY